MIWDSDEEGSERNDKNQVTRREKAPSENDSDKPKILKRKDEKLIEVIKENAKNLKASLDSKSFIDMIDIYEKLVKLYPQVEKIFIGKEIPKLYSKSLYLIKNSIETVSDEVRKNQKSHISKLKTIIDGASEEIKGVIEDYYVDKSDNELDLEEEEQVSDTSFVDEKKEEQNDEFNMRNENTDDPAVRRLKWVKKEYRKDYNQVASGDQKDENKKERKRRTPKKEVKEDEKVVEIEIDDSQIEKEINEKLSMIGVSNKEVDILERVEYLLVKAKDIRLKMKVMIICLNLYYDLSSGQINEIPFEIWKKAYGILVDLNKYTKETYENIEKELKVSVNYDEKEEDGLNLVVKHDKTLTLFHVSIGNFIERLDNELYKNFQTVEYKNKSDLIERLKYEVKLINLCFDYLENPIIVTSNNVYLVPQIKFIVLMHLYYRNSENVNKILLKYKLSDAYLNEINNQINGKVDIKTSIKSFLAIIYYKSNNNNFNEAYEMFISTNLSEIINNLKDIYIKNLYNRTLISLGLSAFKQCNFEKSNYFLSPLCSLGTHKLRDNLFQLNERLSYLSKEDKRKVIPYTMTINIDEIETCYYLSSLLINSDKILYKKIGMKPFDSFFNSQIESFQKQIFNGKPENTKQAILIACQYVLKGDYKKSKETLFSQNDIKNYSPELLLAIDNRLKENCIRCYLILYQYDIESVDIDYIMELYKLENRNLIKKIVNILVFDEVIYGKWKGNQFFYEKNSFENRKYYKNINILKENLKVIIKNNIQLIEYVSK